MTENERLQFWLESNGIHMVLFDLDDTLLDTHPIFIRQMQAFVDYAVSLSPGQTGDELFTLLRDINNQAFREYGVNPNRWRRMVDEMEERIGAKGGILRGGLDILMQIYKTVPEIIPGALVTLETFCETGVSMGLVTHANKKWTNFKLARTGIGDFFEKVLIVDENRHKRPDDWVQAAGLFGKSPSEGMVVGDNLGGDVIAAASAGFGQVVWIDRKDGWSMYRSGDIPEGTIVIPEIGALTQALLGDRK